MKRLTPIFIRTLWLSILLFPTTALAQRSVKQVANDLRDFTIKDVLLPVGWLLVALYAAWIAVLWAKGEDSAPRRLWHIVGAAIVLGAVQWGATQIQNVVGG